MTYSFWTKTSYKCGLKSLQKLQSDDGSGNSLSMCSSCRNSECSNPIEYVSVSVFGNNVKSRLFKTSSSYFSVVSCDGYQKEIIKKDEDEDEEDNN